MKIFTAIISLLLAGTLGYFGVMYGASELGGEVVVLHRSESDGSINRVRVWIVDDNNQAWIEHGSADAHWMTSLVPNSVITVERGGQAQKYRATLDPQAHQKYHALRDAKYGQAERILEFYMGPSADCGDLPVRLDPI